MPGRNRVASAFRILALLLIALAFGYSGLSKLLDPEGAALSVYRYHLVPHAAVNAVALWLGSLELVCTLALFMPKWRISALWLILSLLAIFTLAIGINLARGSHMACGCFSSSPLADPMGWWSILKNIGMMMLVLFTLRGWRVNALTMSR